jgi:hypothetical protein
MYGRLPYNVGGEDTVGLALRKQKGQSRKIERVEARLNAEQKRRIEYAASLKGRSISEFWFRVLTMPLCAQSNSMKCGP